MDEEEVRILLHKVRNSDRKLGGAGERLAMDTVEHHRVEEMLAKISEEENFNAKNRYRLQKTTMDYADKKRMPVDESKLKDVLRNQGIFKDRFNKEIGTY